MRRYGFVVLCLMTMIGLSAQTASAADFGLFQWIFNVNGTFYDSTGTLGSSTLPANFSATPAATGPQGPITVTFTGAGSYDFTAFWDYEIDELLNGFSNETAAVFGAAPAGLSWEVDEPGFVNGDIYTNLQGGASALDNAINSSVFGIVPTPEDVSVGFGWTFMLMPWQTASINLMVSDTAPNGGFYIEHSDPDSDASLFYSTSNSITGDPPIAAPEPATALLMLAGLGLVGILKKSQGTI